MISDTYKRLRRFSSIIILLSLIATSLSLPQKVHASGGVTLLVDTTADNASLTACTSAPGDCSLRGAISHVNADTSLFAPIYEILVPVGTYTLTGAAGDNNNVSGDLDTKPMNTLYITGAGQSSTYINGGGIDRVFDHWGPGTLVLNTLMVMNGHVETGTGGGGGIRNSNGDNLTLINVTVFSNSVSGTNVSTDHGGGIRNDNGQLEIYYSIISSNTAAYSGGIGMYTTNLFMTDSILYNNTATASGGAIGTVSGGSAVLTRCKILENHAQRAAGISINGTGNITLNYSTVSDNTTTAYNGGGLTLFGTSTLSNSTISGNSAASGGGLEIYGTSTLTNVTITGNSATIGGGVYIGKNGNVSFNHVTDAGNSATIGYGSAVFMDDDGTGTGGTFSFQNSIFSSYDPDTNTCNKSPAATFTWNDYGYNLFDQTLNCYTHVFSDLTEAYPALGALGYYGGSTPTLPLYGSSQAIDAANPSDGISSDQRSHSRKDGDNNGSIVADIGAFEYESAVLYLPMVIK